MEKHVLSVGSARSVVILSRLVAAVLLVSAAVVATAQTPQLPPPFPRQNAKKLLETGQMVVWDIVWPKGQPTALHRHVYDQVGTYYARGGRTITTPDGAARQTMTEVGALSTTRKGTTHIEEGNTDPPLRAVFIELKNEKASALPRPSLDAVPFARRGGKEAFDDDRVHVTDITATPGIESDFRTLYETVIVYLGEGRLRVVSDGDKRTEARIVPGQIRYLPRGTHLRETMIEGTPRAMAFEIK